MKSQGKDSKESWVVAFALSCIFFLVAFPVRIGGQIFVNLVDNYQVTRKAASFPLALAFLMRSLSSPFAGYFSSKIGLKAVTFIGCLLDAIGVGGCYFAENITTIDIFLGLCYGTGMGWSTALSAEIVNHHFEKHISKVNGIVFGSSSIGGCIAPVIFEILLKKYGVAGAFLILSAILLNTVPACLLIKIPRSDKKIKLQNDEKTKEMLNIDEKLHDNSPGKIYVIKTAGQSADKEKTSDFNKCFSNSNDENNQIENFSEKSNHIYNSTRFKSNQIYEFNYKEKYKDQFSAKDSPILQKVSNLQESTADVDHKLPNQKNIAKTSTNKLLSVLYDPIYLLINLSQGIHYYVMYMSLTIIVDVVRDKGISDYLEIYFVMGLSVSDMLGRFFLGYIIDKGYMTKTNFSAFCFAIMSLCWLILPWVTNFFITLLLFLCLGIAIGGNTTGQPSVINEFVSQDKRPIALASRHLLYVPMSFTMSPLIGYFRGTLGSYDGLLYTLASICIFCSTLVFSLPTLDSCRRKNPKV